MKNKDFFKTVFSFQDKISTQYAREADDFQAAYNEKHPSQHLWRHILYSRTFFFYEDGRHISVTVTVVRFRIARSNRTFTFYGSLFCAFSNFARSFIRRAVREASDPRSEVSNTVSEETVSRWAGNAPRQLSAHHPGDSHITLPLPGCQPPVG